MSVLAIDRVYTGEKNNQILNAVIDFIKNMKSQITKYYDIKILEKQLKKYVTDINNTLDEFIAYINEISAKEITEQYIENIFKNDNKFYGYIQNLYLYSYETYEILIKLKNKSSEFTNQEIDKYSGMCNLAAVFLSGFIAFLNQIKFKDIMDNVEK